MSPQSSLPGSTPTRAIALLAFAAFASQAMVRVSDPLLPQIAADIGTTVGAASVVASAYAVAHGTTQAVTGPLGDRWPKYRTVMILCALSGVATLACGLSESLTALALARLACGVAAGMIMPLGMAFIGDVVAYERRQPVLGRFISGQITGLLFGQIAGGVIGDWFGWRSVFFFLAGLFAVVVAAVGREYAVNPLTHGSARAPGSHGSLIEDYRRVLRRPWARIITVGVFVEGALMFGALTYVGADLHARHGLGFSAVGGVLAAFGVGGLIYAASVKRLVDRLGQRGLALSGGVITAVSFVLMAVGPAWWFAVGALVTIGLGFYMLHNTLQVNATQMAPDARSTALGIFSSAFYLGMSAGVMIAAPLFDRFGGPPVFIGTAILFPLLAFWVAAQLRRRPAA